MFTAEGVKIIGELLKSDFQIAVIYCTDKYLPALAPDIIKKNVLLELVTETELQKISQLENNKAAVALVHIPSKTTRKIKTEETVLVLDGINDPGNFGTILRTADWFGINNIFCSENTVDIYNPKVINGSMGSIAHIQVHYGDLNQLIKDANFTSVYGTFLNGTPIDQISVTNSNGPIAIIMGSESHGIGKNVEQLITHKITIPQKGKAESLNVAVACGIVLHQFLG